MKIPWKSIGKGIGKVAGWLASHPEARDAAIAAIKAAKSGRKGK